MTSSTRTRTLAALLATTIAAATAVVGVVPATAAPGPVQTAAAAPAGVYAFDDFRRTSTSGWGTGAAGGDWTTTGGSAGDFTVDGTGTAQMNVRGAGWHLNAALNGVSAHSTEVRTRVALTARPTGGSADVDILTRTVATDAGYAVRLKFFPDGRVRVSLIKTSSGETTSLQMAYVPNLTYTDGTVLMVRAQTAGRGITTHRAKVWAATSPEPADWTVNVTDNPGGLTSGSVGVHAYTSPGVTNAPIGVRFSGFAAGPVGATPDAAVYAPPPPPEIGTYVPDATNTGVPAGTTLRVHEGDLRVTQAGQVIDGLDIRGVVRIDAQDVVIRNSIIRGRATSTQSALVLVSAVGSQSAPGGGSVTIEDSELYNSQPGPWLDGVRGADFTLRRVNIHHVIDMAHIYGDDVTIEGSYLHDNLHFENDPAQSGNPSHDDSIQIQVGSNIRIVGNNISGAYNTGIQFTQDRGDVSNVVIEKNLLDGGGCTVNLAEKGRGPFEGVVIRDNTFGRNTRVANCAIISPPTTVLTTANNYFTDGAVAYIRKGA